MKRCADNSITVGTLLERADNNRIIGFVLFIGNVCVTSWALKALSALKPVTIRKKCYKVSHTKTAIFKK